eukprot:jgi/Chlat1/8944/Chrsp94S08250
MPKRTTHTYSSEDAAARDASEAQLRVYYCAACQAHALILDATLQELPVRRADGSSVIDRAQRLVKISTIPGPTRLIRRADGKVERQWREACPSCGLPLFYRAEDGPAEEVRLVYVIKGALSGQSATDSKAASDAPVPPCIQQVGDKVQVAVEVEERAPLNQITRVNADDVRVAMCASARGTDINNELLEFMAKVLGLAVTQVTLERGWNSKSKLLLVESLTTEKVYHKLRQAAPPVT